MAICLMSAHCSGVYTLLIFGLITLEERRTSTSADPFSDMDKFHSLHSGQVMLEFLWGAAIGRLVVGVAIEGDLEHPHLAATSEASIAH